MQGFEDAPKRTRTSTQLSLDQALNLVTRVSDPSYASIASRLSSFLDASDGMDDLDVAADVATQATLGGVGAQRLGCTSDSLIEQR
jgi:hypothetical protein